MIPITIKQLREYRHTKANLLLLNVELDELILRSRACDGTGRSGKTSDAVAQIVLERDKTRKQIEYLEARKKAVEDYIGGCNDYFGMLLRWHYLEGKTWASIALTVGGGNTEDGIKKSCHRYVVKNP